jgi:hypothetical protein
MARYRPIDVRLWTDRRFLSLTDEGKLLWVFLLTTPSTLPIPGVIIGGEATLAEQLGWPVERYRERFQELQQRGMRVRAEGRVVWLSNALKYQPPANPNTIKGWAKTWDDIPEGELKDSVWEALRIACKSWSGLFTKLFPKRFGEPFAQLLLEPLHTGSGSGSETGSGSGSGSGSGEGAHAIRPTDLDLERRRRVGDKGWDRLNAMRAQIAAEEGWEDVRPLHPMDPGRTALATRLRESGGTGEKDLDHVLAVAEAEAKTKRTVEYLNGSIFDPIPWRKKLGMRITDAQRARPIAASGGPTAVALAELDRLERGEA